MAILEEDVKLMQSERMTDTDDGGGYITRNEVVDGEANNLFPDISRLDRTYGRVNMRKAFASVQTDTTDTYYGSHAIITKAPLDPNVGVLLFESGSHSDERVDAQDKIESYVTRGPTTHWFLYDRQISGQRSIQVYQRSENSLPEVGQVLYLVENEGQEDEYGQFIRVQKVDFEDQTFNLAPPCGTFTRRVVTLDLTDALQYDFSGTEIHCLDVQDPETKVRKTNVADASKYYGATGLKEDIAIGDLTVQIDTVYGHLVPSTRDEQGLLDRDPENGIILTIDAGTRQPEVSQITDSGFIGVELNNRAKNYVFTMRPLAQAGTVRVSYRALGNWYDITDNGDGTLSGSGAGTINYATGSILVTLQEYPDVGTGIVFSWGHPLSYTKRLGTPAVPVQCQYTTQYPGVTRNTFIATWTSDAGEVSVTDDGIGGLSGSGGTGSIQYSTGRVAIYPSVLPNPGVVIAFDYNYGPPIIEAYPEAGRNGDGNVELTLSQVPILPHTVELKWHTDQDIPPDTTRTTVMGIRRIDPVFIHDDNGGGGFLGDQVGSAAINYTTGSLVFNPDKIVQFPVANYVWETTGHAWVTISDPGVTPIVQELQVQQALRFQNITYENTPCIMPPDGLVEVSYQTAEGATTAHETTAMILQISAKWYSGEDIVPNSLEFNLGGTLFQDDGFGQVNRKSDGLVAGTIDYGQATVLLTAGWTIGNATTLSMTSMAVWTTPFTTQDVVFRVPGTLVPGNMTISATTLDGESLTAVADLSGNMLGPDIFGWIDYATGLCHLKFGTELLDSGLSPAQKLESWYEAGNVDARGIIVRPRLIAADTVKYNAVIYTYLPLDKDILGLDPVRLPVDGRVPMFRPGDVGVVHQEEDHIFATNPAPSEHVESLPHTFVSNCAVTDSSATAQVVSPYLYAKDNALGAITLVAWSAWAADTIYTTGTVLKHPVNGDYYRANNDGQSGSTEPVWVNDGTTTPDNTMSWQHLGNYTEPFIANYRLEAMQLIADVDINGVLTCAAPFGRVFDASKANVSSALIFRDLQARIVNLFHQKTWTNVWFDSRIGDDTTSKYNDVSYPLIVSNEAAIKERWLILFTSATTFVLIGETVGQIAAGNIGADLQPINSLTLLPYFHMYKEGWGTGWSTGNCVRFNTDAAAAPIWISRCIQSGEATEDADTVRIQVRGDAD